MNKEIKKLELEIKKNTKCQLILQKSIKSVHNNSGKLQELYVELLLKLVEKQRKNVEKYKLLLQSNKEIEIVENPQTQ